jgi:DNA-binding transcriptional ArsR family regulator
MENAMSGDFTRCDTPLIHEEQVRNVQEGLIDGLTATYLAQLFSALADPSRVRMIAALVAKELCVCDLSAVLGMTQSAVSHQLRSLRDLRLVKTRKEGRVVYYSLLDDHIRTLFELGLSHVHEKGQISVEDEA